MPKNASPAAVVRSHFAASAARMSGLSLMMVNYLCRHEIVVPTAGTSRGKGNRRQYSFSDVVLLRAVATLLESGVSVFRLRSGLAALQSRGKPTTELLQRKFLISNGTEVYLSDKNGLEEIVNGQLAFAFVLELDSLRKVVSDQITKARVG